MYLLYYFRRTEAAAASVERVPRQLYSTSTTRATPHDIPKEILCVLTGDILNIKKMAEII
jgi:hypothetical protein